MAVASGGPVVPDPHFMFGPPVAAYIQYCIIKLWSPCSVWPPYCEILTTGLLIADLRLPY